MTHTLLGMEPRNPCEMLDESATCVATPQPWTQYFPDTQLLVDWNQSLAVPKPARTLGTYKILADRSQSRAFLLYYTSFSPILCPISFYFSRPRTSHRERATSMSRKLGRLTEMVSTYKPGGSL